MTTQEAIETIKYASAFNREDSPLTVALDMTIEALEKQIPKKPIIKADKNEPITHRLGRLLYFHCPRCGRFIVGIYETDPERGGGIHEQLKGCSTCLQAIDFSGYYHNGKLDEEYALAEQDWNTRKPIERVVERLEELKMAEYDDSDEEPSWTDVEDWYDNGESAGKYKAYHNAIEIIKEEVG